MESRSCPETVPVGVPGLWDFIALRPDLRSGRGLRELSNAMSHSRSARREQVDFRLLVVRSQTASLTPGPSFAHNLGWKCPNDQCEAIFDIYVSKPFQWHQERFNARCFGPCCWALNIRESRRTPSSQLWECWDSPPHLAQSRVATRMFFHLDYCYDGNGWVWITMCLVKMLLRGAILSKKCIFWGVYFDIFWGYFFFDFI
jgi:hypothetical protein